MNTSMKIHLFLFGLLLIIVSCNQNTKESSGAYLADEFAMEPRAMQEDLILEKSSIPTDAVNEVVNETSEKKIIKDGNMGIKVDDLENAKSKVDTLLKKYNGYYANENLTNNDYEIMYSLRIRIPSNHFEKLITDIESGEYEMQYKNIDARDVTEEFIDLETRLSNKKNYLEKYNELLKQAKSIKDILEIEERIRNIEEEIESTEGRLKYLGNQVALSTLQLNITQEKDFRFKQKKHHNFFEKLKQSFSNGWYAFIAFLLFLVKLWPFWILIALIVWLWKRYRMKRKHKKERK